MLQLTSVVLESQADGYDPRRSNVKEDSLANFIRSTITGDLTEVGPFERLVLESSMITPVVEGPSFSRHHVLWGRDHIMRHGSICRSMDCD
jgi:hypothetical protein